MARWIIGPALTLALIPAAGAAPSAPIAAVPPGNAGADRADLSELMKDPAFRERLQRWRTMSDAERSQLKLRYEQWSRFPEPQRDCIRMSWVRFRTLHPDQQAAAKAWYRALPEEHRRSLKLYAARAYSFSRMNQIPLHHFTSWVRNLPAGELDRIRQLPSDRRAESIQRLNRRFYEHVARKVEAQLPEMERESFRALSFDEKMARVRKWFADRKALDAEKRGETPWWERPLPARTLKGDGASAPLRKAKPAEGSS